MAALAASIAETVAAMQRVISQDDYTSDSDESYLQMSNFGRKLKRKSAAISGGLGDRAAAHKRQRKIVKHAGYSREIIRKNPKRYDDDGDEIATDVEDEAADARAVEENPYSNIRLEHLLAPLSSAAALSQHPSLSEAYRATALGKMSQHANEVLQRERRSLAKAKNLLTELRGDIGWIPAGKLRDPNDDMIFDTSKHYKTIVDDAPVQLHRSLDQDKPPDLGGTTSLERATKPFAATSGWEESISLSAQTGSTTPGKIGPDQTSPGTSNSKLVESDQLAQPGADEQDESARAPPTKSEAGSVLPSVERETSMENQATGDSGNADIPDGHEAMQTPPRRVTRAQAQADRTTASPQPTSSEDWKPPQLHPLFLIPKSAQADQDFGIPLPEAQDTRHLLSIYVQKQEDICRGAERLYEGLLQADRQRKLVMKWCKAEGHVGEMSDGEDWYDKEEWGLDEDLRKGQIEEEEDVAVQGKKTRRGRA